MCASTHPASNAVTPAGYWRTSSAFNVPYKADDGWGELTSLDLYYRRTGFFLLLHVRSGRLSSFELHPYRIMEQGLRRLGRREETDFRKKLDLVSKPLASSKGISEAWQAYLAYYGPDGFKKEVLGILERMETEPRKGAAMFRNRTTTLQHSELWRDALTRFMAEKECPVPPGMTRLIKEWFTRTASGDTA